MKVVKYLAILTIIILATLYLTDTDYLIKAVRTIYLKGHTTAFLEDYKSFDNATISTNSVYNWVNHKQYNTVSATEKLEKINRNLGTIAYLIIKNDSIWFEKYYEGFTATSKTNSFSMAKSYVTSLLGKAIMQGYIKNLNQPICDFLPNFCEGKAANITVGDLASMSSGTNWDEAYYSPLSITTRSYFDDDLAKVINRLKVVNEPGKAFKYASGDTQMLAMVLEKATGKKLYDYLSESFWKPLGNQTDALWQVDSEENKLVKAYCCIASNAKDFARLGKLYKDFGKWNGKTLLDSAFVVKSITPRFSESPQYGYGWWMKDVGEKHFFMMRGHLGQYVIVQPEDNVIIVRLGHKKDPNAKPASFSNDITTYIEEAYKMLDDDN